MLDAFFHYDINIITFKSHVCRENVTVLPYILFDAV